MKRLEARIDEIILDRPHEDSALDLSDDEELMDILVEMIRNRRQELTSEIEREIEHRKESAWLDTQTDERLYGGPR